MNRIYLCVKVQKMLPGVLDVFKTAMDEGFVSVPDSTRLDCSRVVFILISDIGAKEMASPPIQFHSSLNSL